MPLSCLLAGIGSALRCTVTYSGVTYSSFVGTLNDRFHILNVGNAAQVNASSTAYVFDLIAEAVPDASPPSATLAVPIPTSCVATGIPTAALSSPTPLAVGTDGYYEGDNKFFNIPFELFLYDLPWSSLSVNIAGVSISNSTIFEKLTL